MERTIREYELDTAALHRRILELRYDRDFRLEHNCTHWIELNSRISRLEFMMDETLEKVRLMKERDQVCQSGPCVHVIIRDAPRFPAPDTVNSTSGPASQTTGPAPTSGDTPTAGARPASST